MANQLDELKGKLSQLANQRKEIEDELKRVKDDLKGVDDHSNLVDSEGFPRADIDVHAVTIAKSKFVHLRNDYSAVQKEIEQTLAAYNKLSREIHGTGPPKANGAAEEKEKSNKSKETSTVVKPTAVSQAAAEVKMTLLQTGVSPATLPAFLLVEAIVENSPAQAAGLKTGDKILMFGSIVKANFKDIKDLLVVVEQNVEKPIPLFVYRNGEGIKELALVPLLHQGRPTLGCKIVPLKE